MATRIGGGAFAHDDDILTAANGDIYDLVIDVASHTTIIDDLAARLVRLLPGAPE